MAGFRQLVQARLAARQQRFAVHPDAGILSAFAEDHLGRAERAGVVSHLAHCEECRQILALLQTAEERVPVWADTSAVPGRRAVMWHWQWAGVAAVPILA